MSICDSYTIQTIALDECIGTSLQTLNNNFRYLKEQTCFDNENLSNINTATVSVSTNTLTLSSLRPGYAKAWVAFDGNSSGTGSGTRDLLKVHNVASVSSLGIGRYRINFTTPFLNTDYALIGTSQQTSNHTWVQPTTAFQTTRVDINIRNTSGTLQDSDYVSLLIYNN